MNEFMIHNPDYPLHGATLRVEVCQISDADVPSGNGGINGERYTYGELRHQPVIKELTGKIVNVPLKYYAEECNARNVSNGFRMFKVEGEYCFWGLRVGPVVKVPTVSEMKAILLRNTKTARALKNHEVTASMIREVTYTLLRQEIARCCRISESEAANAIGNQLDCAPHEDGSGYIFMVPNWAHKWFRHDGYVSMMLRQL